MTLLVRMASRNVTALKQLQNMANVKTLAPVRTLSHFIRSSKTMTLLHLPMCQCGLPRATVTHISYSSMLRANKVVGMEYEDGKLIYFGAKAPLVRGIQMALYAVGAAITIPSPFLWGMVEQTLGKYLLITWVMLFGIANPLMFHKFSRRYVIELYYNRESGQYTAIVPSIWIFGKSRVVFTSEDCSMPDSPTAFASFLVHKKPLLVSSDNMDYFEYSKMLRHASDLDYENPDRQSQYEETLQDAIREIGSQGKPKKRTFE